MLRDTVVQLIQGRLNRTGMETTIISEMQFVQEFLLEGTGAFTPWFLASEMANVDAPLGEERVLLPTDFLGEIEEQSLWRYDATNVTCPYTELHKTAYDRIILKYEIAGTPQEYAIVDNYILLRPIPDTVYNIRMRYYAKDVTLTSNIENKWLKYAADWVMAETGRILAGDYIRNDALEAKFQLEANTARQRVWTRHEARQTTNRTYGMGED